MKPTTQPKYPLVTVALCACALLAVAANGPEQSQHREAAVTRVFPFTMGLATPLAVQSHGVVWNGNTYHLVKLGSIKFELDKAGRLKAEIQAEVTTFDDVDYDISGAVFDATGQMLGTSRTPCKVERGWRGRVGYRDRTLTLDFGVSLDYARAAAYLVSVSNRKVLIPDDWQK